MKDRDYDIGTNKADDVAVPVTQWQKFERHVANLNSIDEKVKYKVLYLGRHGEGDHNVAERFYGTPAWDAHWSKLDGNGTLYWVDAHLTEKGKTQALDAKAFWKDSITVAKIPAPQSYYVRVSKRSPDSASSSTNVLCSQTSPLYRCLQTADLTFTGLGLPTDRIFHPTIKEFVREVMGVHTCDKRSTRSLIHKDFPDWTIEPGFTEDDELWQVDHRETSSEHDVRMHKLLADIFSYHTATFISITSHSGSIASTLRVLKHREFRLPTGAIIPVLVKVTKP